MSLISFIQDAGEKLFSRPKAAPASPAAAPDLAALNATAAQAIEKYIAARGDISPAVEGRIVIH